MTWPTCLVISMPRVNFQMNTYFSVCFTSFLPLNAELLVKLRLFICSECYVYTDICLRDFKTHFMLNSAEHDISTNKKIC